MDEITLAERLKEVMSIRNLKQVDILEMSKPLCRKYNMQLTKNALSQYVNGKVVPKRNMIRLLAETLNVDTGWLAGFSDKMERETPIPDESEDERTKKLLELFPKMTPSEQRDILVQMERKLSKR